MCSGFSWAEGTWGASRPKRLICKYLFLIAEDILITLCPLCYLCIKNMFHCPQGDKGNTGTPGQRGSKGSEGNQGNQGLRGEKGPPGKQVIIFLCSLIICGLLFPLLMLIMLSDSAWVLKFTLPLTLWCRDTAVHRVTEENQESQGSRSVNINQKEPNQKLYQNLQVNGETMLWS